MTRDDFLGLDTNEFKQSCNSKINLKSEIYLVLLKISLVLLSFNHIVLS